MRLDWRLLKELFCDFFDDLLVVRSFSALDSKIKLSKIKI